MRQVLGSIGLALVAASGAAGQKQKAPARPPVADPNSALAYYRMGMGKLGVDNQGAADALYWALELEPSWPEALYARRVAALRADPHSLIRYMRWDKKVRREFAPMDSGYFRGLMQDPFVYRDLDKDLVLDYWRSSIEENVRRRAGTQDINATELRYEIDKYISDIMRDDSDPEGLGWIAFAERRFPDALKHYGRAVGKKHDNPGAHEDRATDFFLMQQLDSARAELEHALAEFKKKDDKDRVYVYQPKAMLEFKLATVLLRQEKMDLAKEALGRALVEDLSFYPAHLTLSNMALTERDTATAVRELGLAVELKPDDPLPLMRAAELYLATGAPDSAMAALSTVAALKPLYAAPHRLWGEAAMAKGDKATAIARFQQYLKLTVRGDRWEAEIRKKIAELGG